MRKRSFKQKVQHAKAGNVLSQFELFQHYADTGEQENTQKYFDMCLASIGSKQVRVQVLKLHDFRKFRDISVSLSGSLTVLIGDNGIGKTSLLDAIVKHLSWLLGTLLQKDRTGRPLGDHDVNIRSHYRMAASYLTLTYCSESEYESVLVKNLPGNTGGGNSELEAIRSLGDMYRVMNARQVINLPLFMYFSIKRTTKSTQITYSEETFGLPMSRFDAYDNALTGDAGIADFIEWFLPLANLVESEEKNRQYREQEEEFDFLVNLYENSDDQEQQAKFENLIAQRQASLKELKHGLRKGDQFTSQLETIREAVKFVLPGFSSIFVDRSSGKAAVYVTLNDQNLHINQLSDGQQMVLGLVADLARRLTLLNPVLENLEDANPLNGQGIVLIDEIELHLHPKWQQTFLPKLQETFQNIQFIVTTHSPQALSAVDKTCIRKLTDDGRAIQPKFQTKGVMSSDILEQIMGTFSVPKIEETIKLERLQGLIQEGEVGSPDAKLLYRELKEHFGENHPEIKKLDGEIHLIELKKKIQARRKG